MSDNEWITVGNHKHAREGIDTRKKEGSVPQTYMGSANKSSQYERERRAAYWDEKRAAAEAEEAARVKQKQIDFQRSIRNTEANYPSLVNRAIVEQSSSKPVLSFVKVGVPEIVEEAPPVEVSKKRSRFEYIPPPFMLRSQAKPVLGMLDERTEKDFVPECDEEFEEIEETPEEDMYEAIAEWEEFEWNEDLAIVGREFDI